MTPVVAERADQAPQRVPGRSPWRSGTRWPCRVATVASAGISDPLDQGGLLRVGIDLHVYPDAPSTLLAIGAERPQVVLAPTDMAGIDVVDFTAVVTRAAGIPVLVGVLSTAGSQISAFHALEQGARGMTPLPFSARSLSTAVGQLGFLETADAGELRCGVLTLNAQSLRVTVEHTTVHLAPKEFAVLRHLMSESPRVVTVEEIAAANGDTLGEDTTRIRLAIMRTRKKLSEAAPHLPVLIETVRGLGYRMSSPERPCAVPVGKPTVTR